MSLTINAQLQDLEDENYTEDAVEANSVTSNQNRTKKQVMEEDLDLARQFNECILPLNYKVLKMISPERPL